MADESASVRAASDARPLVNVATPQEAPFFKYMDLQCQRDLFAANARCSQHATCQFPAYESAVDINATYSDSLALCLSAATQAILHGSVNRLVSVQQACVLKNSLASFIFSRWDDICEMHDDKCTYGHLARSSSGMHKVTKEEFCERLKNSAPSGAHNLHRHDLYAVSSMFGSCYGVKLLMRIFESPKAFPIVLPGGKVAIHPTFIQARCVIKVDLCLDKSTSRYKLCPSGSVSGLSLYQDSYQPSMPFGSFDDDEEDDKHDVSLEEWVRASPRCTVATLGRPLPIALPLCRD